jgi:hypothetical protein
MLDEVKEAERAIVKTKWHKSGSDNEDVSTSNKRKWQLIMIHQNDLSR